ncbi:restriction endonuclease [Microbulbifer sp. ZKSA006]|uniref:restriction endonuclease n=1 Tax=Microbulbifer sp. ZKSA006 TaxID=3243390 RepID=UPI0040393CC4
MTNAWMIRAGRGGIYSEDFEKGFAAVGWSQPGDLSQYSSTERLRDEYIKIYGNDKPAATANALAMILKFRDQIAAGDYIVSYNPETRNYLLGVDKGEYRDQLPQKAKNSLGSTLTLFSLSQETIDAFLTIFEGRTVTPQEDEAAETDSAQLKDETVAQSHELIKDKIAALLPEEMEELVAAILRAMGFKAKVSPKGPDRGVDVIASPDGLGLTQPRIKAEVKHRNGSMGAPAIRGFIGALREGDSGLFVSTGGFTREARYEADRSTFPLTLVDLDDLADLIVSHYESFDLEGRALMPLVRIYWPVD